MKKVLLFIALLSIGSVAFSQDYKAEIERDFNNYMAAAEANDFQKVMDYMPAEVFEIVPKDSMVKSLTESYNNDTTVLIELKKPEKLEIGKSEKINGKYYSILSYLAQMNIKIKGEEDSEFKEMLLAMYQEIYGEKNVTYNESAQTFEIQSTEKTIAISENGMNSWKFLNVDKGLETFLEKILPKKILKSAF